MSDSVTYKFNVKFDEFFSLLATNENFRNDIINIFKESNFKYAYWEFPPYYNVTSQNLAEFSLIKSSSFGNANSKSFEEHFKGKLDNDIVSFYNLSGDTKLVTINSTDLKNQTFCHIMEFMLHALHKTKHELLTKIGEEMLKFTNSKNKIYLSTHGHGVPWLHIRICNKPKYYTNSAYADM